jgi:uncharacterized coiled-coil protein SlyX
VETRATATLHFGLLPAFLFWSAGASASGPLPTIEPGVTEGAMRGAPTTNEISVAVAHHQSVLDSCHVQLLTIAERIRSLQTQLYRTQLTLDDLARRQLEAASARDVLHDPE